MTSHSLRRSSPLFLLFLEFAASPSVLVCSTVSHVLQIEGLRERLNQDYADDPARFSPEKDYLHEEEPSLAAPSVRGPHLHALPPARPPASQPGSDGQSRFFRGFSERGGSGC